MRLPSLAHLGTLVMFIRKCHQLDLLLWGQIRSDSQSLPLCFTDLLWVVSVGCAHCSVCPLGVTAHSFPRLVSRQAPILRRFFLVHEAALTDSSYRLKTSNSLRIIMG